MNVKEPTQEGCVVRLDIELAPEEVQPHIDEAFETVRKTANLPGFRPGKVPNKVLQQRFGKQVRNEAAEEAIKSKLPEALKDSGVQPIALAPVEDLEHAEDGGISFTAVLEVSPELDPYAWKDKDVERMVVEVTDEDVERHIDSMRRDRAVVTEAGEDDEASDGDRLTVDLQQVDESGVAIIGQKHDTIVFELGSGYLGADADEKLKGMKVGETRRVQIEEPQSEVVETLEEGPTTWDVHLKTMEKVELPEVDDDFAAQVNEKYENAQQFRDDVREQLKSFAQYQANQSNAMHLRDAVIGSFDFEVPPTLLRQTLEDMVRRQMQETGNAYDENALAQYLVPVAQQELQWFFIRRRLIEAENIEATDEEIEQHIENYAKGHEEVDLEQLKLIFKSGEKRDQLADEIIMGKVMEVLRQGVNWVDKPVSFLDVLREVQAQQAQYGAHEHDHDHDHAH